MHGILVSNARTQARSKFSQQPGTIHEGLWQAYESLQRGVQLGMKNVVTLSSSSGGKGGGAGKSSSEEKKRRKSDSYSSAFTRVPRALIQPMIGMTEAVSKTLLAVRLLLHGFLTMRNMWV